MEEDIKNIEEMLEFKEDIIKYHAWVGTKLINSVENLLKRYKELEEENKNARNEIIKIINTPEAIKNSINELKTNQFIGENVKLVILNYIDKITTDNEDLKNDLYKDGLSHKYLTLKATSIPTSVIQNKLSEIDEKIKNHKSLQELHELQAQKFILELILEKGNK